MRYFIIGMLIFFFAFKVEAQVESKKPLHFLVVTDIHFDPFIACENVKPCELIQNLNAAPAKAWPKILMEYDTAVNRYRQNTRYPLLISSLQAMKRVTETNHIEFMLILGDFLGHDFRKLYRKYTNDKSNENYQNFVKKTLIFLTDEFKNYFPNMPIYALIGNNDSYYGDYVTRTNSQFFMDLKENWLSFIKDDPNRRSFVRTFPHAGYYALTIGEHPSLRLLFLNSVLFSRQARGNEVKRDAREELDWLHQELKKAKENNQRVIIAMHIPMGIDIYASLRFKLFTLVKLWRDDDTSRFLAEIDEFASEIDAVLVGHLHSDWYQILPLKNSREEIAIIGNPSISPIFGNNPSFKVYSYEDAPIKNEDYLTYFHPLGRENNWIIKYGFSHFSTNPHSLNY